MSTVAATTRKGIDVTDKGRVPARYRKVRPTAPALNLNVYGPTQEKP